MLKKLMITAIAAILLGGFASPTLALARGGGGGHGGGGHFGGARFGGASHFTAGRAVAHIGGTNVSQARVAGIHRGFRGRRGLGYDGGDWNGAYASCYPYFGAYPYCDWPQ